MIEKKAIHTFEKLMDNFTPNGTMPKGSRIVASILNDAAFEAGMGWSKRAPNSTHTKQYKAKARARILLS